MLLLTYEISQSIPRLIRRLARHLPPALGIESGGPKIPEDDPYLVSAEAVRSEPSPTHGNVLCLGIFQDSFMAALAA